MIFGWKQRRGSRWRVAVLVVVLVLGLGNARAAAPIIVVEKTTQLGVARSQLSHWQQQDRQWLAGSVGLADSSAIRRPLSHLLRDRWIDRGYLMASVVANDDTLWVDAGRVWRVGRWDIGGDDFTGRAHLLGRWLPSPGSVYEAEGLRWAVQRILEDLGEQGYPFGRWVTQGITVEDSNQVTIRALLLPGKKVWVGRVSSDLSDPRAQRFAARVSGIRIGGLFRHSDLARAGERLQARGLYTQVGQPSVYLTAAVDTIGVHFGLLPRLRQNRFQVILGVSRPQNGKTHLSGQVDLRLPNMAGSGRNLQIGWQDDGLQKSRFGFRYLEPLVFGTDLDTELALDSEVERESYTRFRLDNTWSLPVVSAWGIHLGLGWDRTIYPTGELQRTLRWRASGSISHRRLDRSQSGWSAFFGVENAWRSTQLRPELPPGLPSGLPPDSLGSASGGVLGQSVVQRIYRLDLSGEWWAAETVSFFGRGSVRQLNGADPVVPLAEQFRFGGARTLRGYLEDEFHGSEAVWSAVEMRIGSPGRSRLYTFYDLGYFQFWRGISSTDDVAQTIRFRRSVAGFGLGLLAKTSSGDISLAIGFPGTFEFERAKLHVTLLESF